MYLSHLSLTNYRNFQDMNLELPSGMVFIFGRNAQGKSNLLEAIYLLVIGKSYRTNIDKELMFQEIPSLKQVQTLVSGEVKHKNGTLKAMVGLQSFTNDRGQETKAYKQIRVNGSPTTVTRLVGCINAVLFTPNDIDLVFGPPSGRRRFLDILISQVDRNYLHTLQRYHRVITQRNHLLRLIRDKKGSRDELDFWDEELVKEATVISSRRSQVLEDITPMAQKSHFELTGHDENLDLQFEAAVPVQGLKDTLRVQREREIIAGMTIFGPHRDDLLMEIDGMNAATYSSRGQARSIALALRLAEAFFLKRERGEEPLLLLDDVLSELDKKRRHRVLEEAGKYEQILATTAERLLIQNSPIPPSATYMLERGKIIPQHLED
jgi:DNA replication and repair protein RecF